MVVLIDGLWKRQQTGASARLRDIEDGLAARRDAGETLDVTKRQDGATSWPTTGTSRTDERCDAVSALHEGIRTASA
jgi:hypothetical protein